MRCVAIVLFLFACCPWASAERQFTDEQWREDIETYVQKLKSMHKNAFHSVSEADFQSAVNALVARLPELSDQQIGLEMSRLAALIGDGHTWIAPDDAWAPARLPLVLFQFEDGVFVVRTMDGHPDLAGEQVLAIGGKPVDDLSKSAEAYTSRDNEWSLRGRRISLLTNRTFLENAGAATPGIPAEFTLRRTGSGERKVAVESVPATEFYPWIEAVQPVTDADLPLYRQHPEKSYWVEYLEKDKALYMRFNSVTNNPGGPHLAAFSEQLVERIEKEKPQKLIIDARNNGGGNGDLLKPLIRRISENKRINRRGHLFVITNRVTFSAALMLTVRMDMQTEALFAGEPGGGKPNSYSERTNFTLPNTKMEGGISSRYHEEGGPGDTREFVPMDIPVSFNSADYFGKRDPVLEAVLGYKD